MLDAIFISLKVALLSTLVSAVIGSGLAYIFTKYNFKMKDIIETVFFFFLALPPTVIGYHLIFIIGRNGFFGKPLYEKFDINILFTWQAACIAAIVVSFPLVYQNVKTAFEHVEKDVKEAAKIFGANEFQIFLYIVMPLSVNGIVRGIILGFVRALGEFGATLIVAGNIPGKTQTIPMLIYFSIGSGDTRTANILVIIVTVLTFVLILITNYMLVKDNTRGGKSND